MNLDLCIKMSGIGSRSAVDVIRIKLLKINEWKCVDLVSLSIIKMS